MAGMPAEHRADAVEQHGTADHAGRRGRSRAEEPATPADRGGAWPIALRRLTIALALRRWAIALALRRLAIARTRAVARRRTARARAPHAARAEAARPRVWHRALAGLLASEQRVA